MNRLAKGLAALGVPAYWPTLLRGVVPGVDHRSAFVDREYATVLDVGANKGQFATFARHRWPDARLLCFEPLPGPRAKLASVLPGSVEIHPIALGSVEGQAEMHVATRDDSSSLLPLGAAQKELFALDEESVVAVPVRRLDALIGRGELQRPVLLKIDVQGFEFETLQGAAGLLDTIDSVYVECSFMELYVGQQLAAEVAQLLSEFELIEAGRFNLVRKDDIDVQADLLFERKSSSRT